MTSRMPQDVSPSSESAALEVRVSEFESLVGQLEAAHTRKLDAMQAATAKVCTV